VYLLPTQFSIDANNNLTFLVTVSTVTVTYQTASAGSGNLSALQAYYTAILRGISFKKP